MKNLDLNKYGVQEMNEKEMKTVDGGWTWIGSAVGFFAGLATAGPIGAAVGFVAGGLADQVPIRSSSRR